MIALGRHMDLHYQQLWDIPGICMNALAIGLTMKMLALFKDIFSRAKQNPVTRNAVVHLIPEWRSRPN